MQTILNIFLIMAAVVLLLLAVKTAEELYWAWKRRRKIGEIKAGIGAPWFRRGK